MPMAVLVYNLDDNDDETSFCQAAKANDMALAIWSYREELRRKIKDATDGESTGLYRALDILNTQLEDYAIDIESLCP